MRPSDTLITYIRKKDSIVGQIYYYQEDTLWSKDLVYRYSLIQYFIVNYYTLILANLIQIAFLIQTAEEFTFNHLDFKVDGFALAAT